MGWSTALGKCVDSYWDGMTIGQSWTATGRLEPPGQQLNDNGIKGMRFIPDSVKMLAGDSRPVVLMPSPAPAVRRWLVWRGKRWQEGVCNFCKRTRPLMPNTYCGKRSLSEKELAQSNSISPIVTHPATYTILQFGGYCSQCTYRVIEDLERAVSELRSACAGGTWTEPEAKP